jgi:2-hydroxymuconate-semialdehyde hydrolase
MSVQAPEAIRLDVAGVATALIDVGPVTPAARVDAALVDGASTGSPPVLLLLEVLGSGPVDIIGNSMGGAVALSIAAARPRAVRRIVLMGSMGVATALPAGLNTVWGYTPGIPQMREVTGLFAHDRRLITDELIELRYQSSLDPQVSASFLAAVRPFLAA